MARVRFAESKERDTVREYGLELVKALQEQQDATDCHGVPVVIKVNPEEPRPGHLDPRELDIMKKSWGKPADENAKKFENMSPKEQLQAARDSMGFPNRNLNNVEIHTKYECLTFDGNEVGLWRYYPRWSNRKPGTRPCLVFLHGGGWIGGSVYTVENQCKLIAELADAVVFNVDYSLAPEKKFPNGFNDCFNAVKHIFDHAESYGIDRTKICVAGDSAGGNLAAAVAVKDRDLGTRMVSLQVLIYPCVTFVNNGVPGYKWDVNEFVIADEERSTIEPMLGIGRPTDEEGDGEEEPMMGDAYVANLQEARSPYVSPALVDSTGLPRALCVGAEFDGLRVQTEFYAKKLAAAGVPVKTIRYKGCTHAFFDKLAYLPQTEDLCIEIANAMMAL